MKRHTAVSLAATFTLLCCSILPVGAYDMGSPEEPLRLSAGLSHTVYVDETAPSGPGAATRQASWARRPRRPAPTWRATPSPTPASPWP